MPSPRSASPVGRERSCMVPGSARPVVHCRGSHSKGSCASFWLRIPSPKGRGSRIEVRRQLVPRKGNSEMVIISIIRQYWKQKRSFPRFRRSLALLCLDIHDLVCYCARQSAAVLVVLAPRPPQQFSTAFALVWLPADLAMDAELLFRSQHCRPGLVIRRLKLLHDT